MAEAAAAFRFQDSDLVAAREAVAEGSEAGAVAVVAAAVAAAGAVGQELRPDRTRVRHHRRIPPHFRRRGRHRSDDLCAVKTRPNAA